MKKTIAAITLLVCMTVTLCFANSCGTSGNNDDTTSKDSSTSQPKGENVTDDDLGITAPLNDSKAIIHMIKDVNLLLNNFLRFLFLS